MKESKVINSSELKGLFAANQLISLGYRYQRGIAVPYVVGKSLTCSCEDCGPPEYDDLDHALKGLDLKDGELIYIVLGE